MKFINILSTALIAATAFSGCYKGELYDGGPDWVVDSIAAIAERNSTDNEEVIEGLKEDVYNIGTEDLTAPFQTFGKTYIIPAKGIWKAQFNLTVCTDNKYYKNVYFQFLDESLSEEYGVIRYDNDPNKNSEWGNFDRSLVSANFTNTSGDDDIDVNVQKLNGKVTLTVDRSNGGLYIEINNGTCVKKYTQTKAYPDADGSSAPLAVKVGVEGAFVKFLGTTIDPVGGRTSAKDKNPISLTLKNVPEKVVLKEDLSLSDITMDITATVTFEEGVTKEVVAQDLIFKTIPEFNSTGEKKLIVLYNKTYKGENFEPVMAYADFTVISFKSIKVKDLTLYIDKNFYNETDIIKIPKTGLNVVGVESNGNELAFTSELLKEFKCGTVKAQAGTHDVHCEWDGHKTTFKVTVVDISEDDTKILFKGKGPFTSEVLNTNLTGVVKLGNNSYSKFSFTAKSLGDGNAWFNPLFEFKSNPEVDPVIYYSTLRTDAYGWTAGWDISPTWDFNYDDLKALNIGDGKEFTGYSVITNYGGTVTMYLLLSKDEKICKITYHITAEPECYFSVGTEKAEITFD